MIPRCHRNELGLLAWLSPGAFIDGAANAIAVGIVFHAGYKELLTRKLTVISFQSSQELFIFLCLPIPFLLLPFSFFPMDLLSLAFMWYGPGSWWPVFTQLHMNNTKSCQYPRISAMDLIQVSTRWTLASPADKPEALEWVHFRRHYLDTRTTSKCILSMALETECDNKQQGPLE